MSEITGLHHISIVSGFAQRTVDFYTRVLGLPLVKKTVNFDDPRSYHLYFGNETGRPGIGGTHHYALEVANYDGLLKWKRRLTNYGLIVDGPLDRHYFTSIYFRDPYGTIIEIATRGSGFTVDEKPGLISTEFRKPPAQMMVNNRDEERITTTTWPEPVPLIFPDMTLSHSIHHNTAIGTDIECTHAFFHGVLDIQRVKMTSNFDDSTSTHWYWGADDGWPGTLITCFERNHRYARYHQVRIGAGQTHHFAFSVSDEETQLLFREKLIKAGNRVTPVLDCIYFNSTYTNDPDGHIVEIATAGPGFVYDEDQDSLGTALNLPPWLEADQDRIEPNLSPVAAHEWPLPRVHTEAAS